MMHKVQSYPYGRLSGQLSREFRIHIHIQTVQRPMSSECAKRTMFYHITVILQYCWDKTIPGVDDSGILCLVIKYFGITNTSVQNFGQ